MDLGRGRSHFERVAKKPVNAEGDKRRHRGPEECGPNDRRERLSWPGRAVEPTLQVRCAKTEFGRDQKADCGARDEKHEVLIKPRKDKRAEGFRQLCPWSNRLQAEKIRNNKRSSQRAGGDQENERSPGISTPFRNHRPLSNIDTWEFEARRCRSALIVAYEFVGYVCTTRTFLRRNEIL